VENGGRKKYTAERNEEAPENGKESLHAAHDNGMNECKSSTIFQSSAFTYCSLLKVEMHTASQCNMYYLSIFLFMTSINS
jgi:hypothetical protein